MLLACRPLVTLLVFGLPTFAASVPGIKNFDQVDTDVYRGGQPTDQGFQYLARLGVKTVLDLRSPGERSNAEKRVVTAVGMKYVNVPMGGLTPPIEAQMTTIFALLENSTMTPIFVHCRRGADRTGVVIAAYQIDHHKWDNARALEDANAHTMGFFQFPRRKYIRNFKARTVEAKGTSSVDTGGKKPAAATGTESAVMQH